MTFLRPESARVTGPRRVLVVSHTASLYGAGRSLLELVGSLQVLGLEVAVVLPGDGPLVSELTALGCRIWHAPVPIWVQAQSARSSTIQTLDDFRAATGRLCRIVEPWSPDLVWTNSSVTPVGALAAAALDLKHVWHLRELNGGPFPIGFKLDVAEATGLIRSSFARVAVSRSVKRYYEDLGCGYCEWIYNGIGPESLIASRPVDRDSTGPAKLLIVGRVGRYKKTATAIEATHELTRRGYPVVLRVVGDGETRHCRDLAEKLGIGDRVEFTGFVKRVDEHYRWADIALSCAVDEAMGRSTAEAMSWGLPVSGFGAAGTREMVSSAGAGLLHDGTNAGIARSLATLIEDPVLTKRMGEAGQQWARRHVSSERHRSRIMELVDSIFPARAPRVRTA